MFSAKSIFVAGSLLVLSLYFAGDSRRTQDAKHFKVLMELLKLLQNRRKLSFVKKGGTTLKCVAI